MIVITLCFIIMVTKYFKAKDDKEACFVNLDRHLRHIKELRSEAEDDKENFEKNVIMKEVEIDEEKKAKINAESKLRLCESQNHMQQKDIRFCLDVYPDFDFLLKIIFCLVQYHLNTTLDTRF